MRNARCCYHHMKREKRKHESDSKTSNEWEEFQEDRVRSPVEQVSTSRG